MLLAQQDPGEPLLYDSCFNYDLTTNLFVAYFLYFGIFMISAFLGTDHSVTTGIIDRTKGIDWQGFSDIELWVLIGFLDLCVYIPHRSVTMRKQYCWLEDVSCQTSVLSHALLTVQLPANSAHCGPSGLFENPMFCRWRDLSKDLLVRTFDRAIRQG